MAKPGRKRSITDEELDLACELRETTDLSLEQIARRIGGNATADKIRWHLREVGCFGPRDLAEPVHHYRPAMRNGHPIRPITPEESDLIIREHMRQPSFARIAKMVGRSPVSVRVHILSVARRQAMEEGL